MKAYRRGGIGALMDEYERAASDLRLLLQLITEDQFVQILDTQTSDEECRSVQSIISHVVNAGYGYADYIRAHFRIPSTSPARRLLRYSEAVDQLTAMLSYSAQTLDSKWELTEEQIAAVIINTRWGVKYDLEQLMEHAIVHVLRHRRQIERLRGEQRPDE
jgi:uncharacterized damage-inducible protein DinB